MTSRSDTPLDHAIDELEAAIEADASWADVIEKLMDIIHASYARGYATGQKDAKEGVWW